VNETRRLPQAQRLPTGADGLDTILHGGLLPGSVYIIQGPPGAGKTILANQVCFHHVRGGEAHALYLTLQAESSHRFLQQLEQLSFYDPARVSESLRYLSAQRALTQEGAKGLLQLLMKEARAHKASLIVLDGLTPILESFESDAQLRSFLNDVSAVADMLDCAILLLASSGRGRDCPEFAMVDAWIELEVYAQTIRTYRTIEVHKYRRSGFISGQHFFTVDEDGFTVYPRLESTVGADPHPPRTNGRLESGIPELDTMMGGGLHRASTTLLAGPSGIGKTTFGLHYLSHCSQDQPGLVFGFFETQEHLLEQATTLGLDLQRLVDAGHLEMVWQPPTEHFLDRLGHRLLAAVERRGVKRLFIDGINGFERSAVFPTRLARFLTALCNELQRLGVTSVCTYEVPELVGGETQIAFSPISAVAQNILLLRYVELESDTKRVLNFIKVRKSRFDSRIREFHITDKGIALGQTFRHSDRLLTGHAQPQSGGAEDTRD
jgi:circadian clock protein KaiC